MISLILRLVVAIIVLAAVAYVMYRLFFSKTKKASTQQSSAESLLQTMNTKFNKLIKDLNNRVRTPEVIKQEIEELLDNFHSQKCAEFKEAFKRMERTHKALETQEKQIDHLIHVNESSLEEIKEKYNAEPNDEIAAIGAETLASLESARKMKVSLAEKQEAFKKAKIQLQSKLEMFSTKFQLKRSDIMLMITNYELNSSFDANISLNCDISSLIDEFETKQTEMEIDARVDKAMNPQMNVESEATVADIAKFKEFCK